MTDSRIFGSEEWQEVDFRESQADQVSELKKELGVLNEQLDELVWKAKMDALQESGEFDESKIKLFEDEKNRTKNLPLSNFEELLEASGAQRIIGRRDSLGWTLYALKEEKKRRAEEK